MIATQCIISLILSNYQCCIYHFTWMPQYMLVCAYFNYYIQNPWSMSPEMGLTLLEDNNRPSYKHPSPSQWDFLHSGSGSAIGISPSQSPDNAAPQMGYKRTQLCSRDFPNSKELLARTVDGVSPTRGLGRPPSYHYQNTSRTSNWSTYQSRSQSPSRHPTVDKVLT